MSQPKMKELYRNFIPTVLPSDKQRKSQKQKNYPMDPSSLLARILVAPRWKRRSRRRRLLTIKPPKKKTRRSIPLMTMTTRKDPELQKNRQKEDEGSAVAVEEDVDVADQTRNTTRTMMNCLYPPVDRGVDEIERMVVEEVVVVEEEGMARKMSPLIDREEDVMVVEEEDEGVMETMRLRHREVVEVMDVIMRIPPEEKVIEAVEDEVKTRADVIMEGQKVVVATETGVEAGAAIVSEEEQGVDEHRRPNSVAR